jgi:CDP-paratose 2-epimerase
MKYLITGGLGVIGSHFAEDTLSSGHSAIIIDAAEEPRNIWMANFLQTKFGNKLEIIIERLEKSRLIGIETCDRVFHAAAHTGIPHSAIDPTDDWLSNAEATRVLLEKLRSLPNKIPLVALSSVKPYKVDTIPFHSKETRYEWNLIKGINENFPLGPDEPYAASKMAQSALCMAYARTYDMPIVCFRCSNLYGAAPSHGPRHGWLTWFCLSAALGRKIEIQGTGLQVRDMLFSDDVSSAAFAAFEHMEKLTGSVYNIGGGIDNSVSVLEAVELLKQLSGRKIGISYGQGRKNEDQIFITDFSKFNSLVDWSPKVSVIEGMNKILRWAEQNKEELIKMYDWCK